jgi:hypothetical protein
MPSIPINKVVDLIIKECVKDFKANLESNKEAYGRIMLKWQNDKSNMPATSEDLKADFLMYCEDMKRYGE